MKKEWLISVIVGSYNGADFLNETIDSILRQTYRNIELILVDDGSKDNTLEIMQGYAERDSRVCVLHHENSGPSATREAGYRASAGDYIVLSDDDDVWSPYLIEDFMNLSAQYEDADAIATYNRQSEDFSEISNYNWEENLSRDKFGEARVISGHEFSRMYKAADKVRPCIFWGIFFKRAFMENMVKEFMKVKEKLPTHYFNDSFCSCKVFGMADKIVLTNQIHILYRVSSSSLCHKSTISLHVKHYIYASEEAMVYYKALGWNDVYEMTLPGWYLVLLRSWFMVYAHEKNEKERNSYFSEVHRLYDQYIDDLRRIKHKGINGKAVYWCILLWNRHPMLWFRLIKIIRGW